MATAVGVAVGREFLKGDMAGPGVSGATRAVTPGGRAMSDGLVLPPHDRRALPDHDRRSPDPAVRRRAHIPLLPADSYPRAPLSPLRGWWVVVAPDQGLSPLANDGRPSQGSRPIPQTDPSAATP
jgi:hypothetical protein